MAFARRGIGATEVACGTGRRAIKSMSPGWKAAERSKPLFASISRRRSRRLEKTRSWILNVCPWCRNGCAIFVAKTASTHSRFTPQNPPEHPRRIEVQEGAELSEWDGLDRPKFAQAHRVSVAIVVETERALQDSRGEPKKVHDHERHPPSPIHERKHVANRSFRVTEEDLSVDETALSNSLFRTRRPPPRRRSEACLLGSGAL